MFFSRFLSAVLLNFFTFCSIICEHHHRNSFNPFWSCKKKRRKNVTCKLGLICATRSVFAEVLSYQTKAKYLLSLSLSLPLCLKLSSCLSFRVSKPFSFVVKNRMFLVFDLLKTKGKPGPRVIKVYSKHHWSLVTYLSCSGRSDMFQIQISNFQPSVLSEKIRDV